jgi:hypothetical protein
MVGLNTIGSALPVNHGCLPISVCCSVVGPPVKQ